MKHFSRLVALSALSLAATPAAQAQSSVAPLNAFVQQEPIAPAPQRAPKELILKIDGVETNSLRIPPHDAPRAMRATVEKNGKQRPLLIRQTDAGVAYAFPVVVGVAKNADGSATLTFPPAKTVVDVSGLSAQPAAVGSLAEVSFQAAPEEDPLETARARKFFAGVGLVLASPFLYLLLGERAAGLRALGQLAASKLPKRSEQKKAKRPRMG